MSYAELIPLAFVDNEPETPAEPPPWGAGLIASTVLAILVVSGLAGWLLLAAAGAYQSAPYSDAHDWIYKVFETERTGDWMGFLWAPQTAQRIPIARAATALDIELVKGRLPTFLIVAAALWLTGLASLQALIWRSNYSRVVRLGLAVTTTLLALNVGLAEDFALPVFSVYLFVAGPALAALTAAAFATSNGWRSAGFWAAVIFAGIASLGNAAGLAVWPALLLVFALQRQDKPTMVLVGLAAALSIMMIESGLGLPSQSFRGGGGEHLAKIVEYFLIFGGLPWSRGLHALSEQAIVGGVVWLVVAAAALGALRRRDWRPPTGAGLALIAFGLMAASMAAVGRVDELPTPIVPTRYTPFATLLQIGAVLASAPLWRGVDARRPFALAAAVGFVLIVVAGTYPTGVRGLQRTASRIHAAGELFDRTGRQDEVVLHPRPAFAADVRRELARRGLPH